MPAFSRRLIATPPAVASLAHAAHSPFSDPAQRGPGLQRIHAAAPSGPGQVLSGPDFPAEWPYLPADFERQDESSDGGFYSQPRLVPPTPLPPFP